MLNLKSTFEKKTTPNQTLEQIKFNMQLLKDYIRVEGLLRPKKEKIIDKN